MASANALWSVGVVIAFIGSFSGALGDNMVRAEYVKTGPNVKPSYLLMRWKWVLGMTLTTVVDVGCTLVALFFAPSTIVTPFAGVHIFWNIFLAKLYVGEKVGIYEVLGSCCVISGVVIVVVFAGKTASMSSFQDSLPYMETCQSIAYGSVATVILMTLVALSFQKVANALPELVSKHVQRFSTAAASGFFGGNTNVTAKLSVIFFTNVFCGDLSGFYLWQSYVILSLTLCFALSQLIYLNLALKRYEAIYVVPTTNSCLVASGVVGAVVVLQEYPDSWWAFSIGILFTITGILLLTIMHTSEGWNKIASKIFTLEQPVDIDVPSEIPPAESVQIDGISSRSDSGSIYSALSWQFSLSISRISSSQVCFNSQNLHAIESMQEQNPPTQRETPKSYWNRNRPPSSSSRSTHSLTSNRIGLASDERPFSFKELDIVSSPESAAVKGRCDTSR